MAFPKKKVESSINIVRIHKETVTICIVGTSPMIVNRVSQKARGELLLPRGPKSSAEKRANLKHNPVAEFRNSAYLLPPKADTLIGMPATAFKGAMMTATADLEGVTRAGIGRLVYVQASPEFGECIEIYGLPKLLMSVVRNSDMARTPDIRTRLIIPEWCARLTIRYVSPLLKEGPIINLLANSGVTVGIGDYRQEKGKGAYGLFTPVNTTDKDFLRIEKAGKRKAQIEAFDAAEPYDDESREMLTWFHNELPGRGWQIDAKGVLSEVKSGGRNGKAELVAEEA